MPNWMRIFFKVWIGFWGLVILCALLGTAHACPPDHHPPISRAERKAERAEDKRERAEAARQYDARRGVNPYYNSPRK